MYRTVRITRIIISLIALGVPTWALIAGYNSVFVRMQILTALVSGVLLVLAFWALVTVIYGRIYCSTVCPLGTLTDCVSAASRLVRRSRRNYRHQPPSRRTQVVFLIFTFLTLLSGGTLIPTLLDPYSAYARMVNELVARPLHGGWEATRFAIASLSVAAFTALVTVGMAWKNGRLLCNTFCPIGTILGYGSRRSYFHIEIDPDRCISCGECERVCKASCIKLPEKIVDTTRCVVCFDCTTVCPNNAINYRSGKYRLDMPMMQRLDRAKPTLDTSSPANSQTCNTDKK